MRGFWSGFQFFLRMPRSSSRGSEHSIAMKLKLLSAGAVKPGLVKVIDAFTRESGHEVEVAFATPAAIRQQLSSGESTDLVIAPAVLFAEITRTGKIRADERVTVGRIGVGVMIRDGAPVPKIPIVND